MRLPTKDNCTVLVKSLPLVCLCGLVGILLDIDHVAAYFQGIPQGADVRIWHIPILIGVGIVMLCLSALSGGLYIRTVLVAKGREALIK
jgi:hypothetical protein